MNEEFEKMRAEFEAWLDARPGRLRNRVDGSGDSPLGKFMWEAWQASRKQALEECKVALIACDLGGLSLGDGIEAIRAMQKD